MKCVWVANDGRTFETSQECANYEAANDMNNNVRFWDIYYNEFDYDEFLSCPPDEAVYVYVKSDTVLPKLQSDNALDGITDIGFWYFDRGENIWKRFEDLENEYQKIQAIREHTIDKPQAGWKYCSFLMASDPKDNSSEKKASSEPEFQTLFGKCRQIYFPTFISYVSAELLIAKTDLDFPSWKGIGWYEWSGIAWHKVEGE